MILRAMSLSGSVHNHWGMLNTSGSCEVVEQKLMTLQSPTVHGSLQARPAIQHQTPGQTP
jgi:hypothetical protein